ncbi:glycogen synthase isoform 1 [Hanseniaspora vineae]
MTRDIADHLLFETSTETANKVGGIYSVLKSKAPVTIKQYGPYNYHLLGPLNRNTYEMEVDVLPFDDIDPEEELDPETSNTSSPYEIKTIKRALLKMQERGVKIVYGKWLIDGSPRVILFDIDDPELNASFLNEWKKDLWEKCGIPSPENDFETNRAIMLGYLVSWFLGELCYINKKNAIVAHFHEWLASVACPVLRARKIDCCTIFTTHATLLGRYLCAGKDKDGNDIDFYNNLQFFDCDEEAGKRGIYHRYCIERAAAHTCDVFTTVSDITALEAEHLLKRKPDGILPNGLNVTKFQAVHEFQNLHLQNKLKINDFVKGHFLGHLDTIDFNNILYIFIAGRYEFKNKGVDMFIESLARLNYKLQCAGSKITVVAFIIMPAENNSYNLQTLQNQAYVRSLESHIKMVCSNLESQLLDYALVKHSVPQELSSILATSDQISLKKKIFKISPSKSILPSITTHNIPNPDDPILSTIRRVKLFNNDYDRVKIIFHPEFLNSQNPILPLEYEEFVRGCHLGVFPSYYEPWGYTPAECTVMGIPSITTNLSGFGAYMEDLIDKEQSAMYGIYVVDRRMKSGEESIAQLVDYMEDFCSKTTRQRINQRNRCERLSDLLDWKRMGLEYVKARNLALKRAYPDVFAQYLQQDDQYGTGTPEIERVYKVGKPFSVPGSPRATTSGGQTVLMTPGDLGTIQDANYVDDYFHLSMGGEEEET